MVLRKVFIVALVVLLQAVIAFANQDNGKDAPYFSRMPNYYIAESSQQEYGSHGSRQGTNRGSSKSELSVVC